MKIIENNVGELYRIFDLLNKTLFNNALEVPVILIQSKRKRILGTCTVNRIWVNKIDEDDKKYYEISLSAENLNRPVDEIVETLLHEMVHLHCSLNDINDTSNNHVYHNKRYKAEAEAHGLDVECATTIGWSVTTLNATTLELIKTFKINEGLFNYYRNTPQKSAPTSKSIRYKYTCTCGVSFTISKELFIRCELCHDEFKRKEI